MNQKNKKIVVTSRSVPLCQCRLIMFDPVLIAFRQQMLYAPNLLLPSQHLYQLQECLVTSHLPCPNILGTCKRLNKNTHLLVIGWGVCGLRSACLIKTTKSTSYQIDNVLSTIHIIYIHNSIASIHLLSRLLSLSPTFVSL